jgi:Ni/Fe-hydrogenase 1 B-type cytochrome subunit
VSATELAYNARAPMSLFRYGRDFYTDEAAQQLLSAGAWLLVAIVGIAIGVHLLRRSTGHPVSTTSTRQVHPRARVLRYEIGARLYHWGNTLLLLGLALTGIVLFAPGSLGRGSWLLLHEIFAVLFVLALALHIFVAPRRGHGPSMWFDTRDLRDLRLIAANFLGRTRDYPAFGKYDPWQKIYHACLTLLTTGLTVSGAYLFVSAEAWGTFSHEWMRLMRLTHDLSAFTFIAIVVGHVYFGLIRVNWPRLVSMVTGHLRGSSFNLYHDAARWSPGDKTMKDRLREYDTPRHRGTEAPRID